MRSAWRFLLFVLLYFIFMMGFMFLASIAVYALPQGFLEPNIVMVLITVVAGLAAVCLATIIMLIVEDKPVDFIGLGFGTGWGRETMAGFALGFAMIAAMVIIILAAGETRIVAIVAGSSSPAGALAWLALFLLLFLMGAAHEEMLFRGYPFQRLLEVLGVPLTVLLLAAAFGAVHYGNPHASLPGTVNTALVGVLFALAYLRTGRLWLPIGLHWSWNFFEAAFGFPVSGIRIEKLPFSAVTSGSELIHGGGYGPEASLPATVVIIAATALLMARWPEAGPTGPATTKEAA